MYSPGPVHIKKKDSDAYDAMGNRVRKIHEKDISVGADIQDWEIHDYVRDASGNILADYSYTMENAEDPKDESNPNYYLQRSAKLSHHLYGSSRLGTKTVKDWRIGNFENLDTVPTSIYNTTLISDSISS